jgi:predicted O-methyltransferase YrrM
MLNSYTTGKYLNYILFSTHRKGHGIHSPFLFNLIINVFRNKTGRDVVLNIESIRKKILSDRRVIKVTDYGSGQGRRDEDLRKVSEIARNSPVPVKYGKLLSKLSKEFGRECVIELGTSLGIGAMYLAAGAPDAVVNTIEGCPQTSAIARDNIKISGYKNIILHTGTFSDQLEKLKNEKVVAGLIFVDGDHRREKVLEYFDLLYTMSDERTVMVFDDIHSSAEMGEAWKTITGDNRVTLSVDIFRMGIIFFIKGLTPSGFIIRY